MGRPSKWATPTTAIRVPSHLADKLIDYAQLLETSFVQNSFEETESVMVTLDSGSDREKRKIVTASKAIWEQADRLAKEIAADLRSTYSKREMEHLVILFADRVFGD